MTRTDSTLLKAGAFEEVLVREAAVRVLFPTEADDPKRSRVQRKWLASFGLDEVIAGDSQGTKFWTLRPRSIDSSSSSLLIGGRTMFLMITEWPLTPVTTWSALT